MTVEELIIKLENLDKEKEIFVYNMDTGNDEKIEDVYQNENGSYYI